MDVYKDSQLNPSDIKLLRLFVHIVRCGGFKAAHEELNIGMSTISTQMALLEERLGMTLCQRGRGGFLLTPQGQRVFDLACEFEITVARFRAQLGSLKDKLVGNLAIGLPDSIVTHPDLCIDYALHLFNRREHSVEISLRIHKPDEIEEMLIADKLQVGISVFSERRPELEYHFLTSERHELYCGRRHPLFGKRRNEITKTDLEQAPYVTRGYDIIVPGGCGDIRFDVAAVAHDMEAILIMILSGAYIGHLPCHYALHLVQDGELRMISEDYPRVSNFQVAFRTDYKETALLAAFVEDLFRAHE
ncbi:MAG: LysR family transcriptional regulator [Castellaniella sp.]